MQPVDIRPDHLEVVRGILAQHVPDAAVWIFGSRAKWLARDTSDLDLCIRAGKPVGFERMGALREAFEESSLPYKVDVVDWATTSESFRKIIERDRVVVQKGIKGAVSPAPIFGELRKVENWTTKLVSDIADLNPSRSLKKGVVSPFIEMAALPVNGRDIPVQDISTRNFSGSGSRFENGDVLLARITPCLENGKTALVNVLGPSVVGHGSTEFIVLSAKEGSDQRFIYYLARHPDFREYAIQHMEGTSGRQRVSATSVGAFRFLCPPLAQRKEIGDTLGALDDRISLLRETNATLEAIAQAMFKSWFVDFDPVRAKAEGREPEGVPPEIAKLFPSEFEDSEIGEIPKGWKTKPIYDLAEYINGAAYKAFSPNGEKRGLPIIKIAELKAGITPQTACSDVSMPEKYLLETGDILLSWSGNPETSIGTFIWHYGRAWLNQHIFRVVVRDATERPFVLQTLKHLRPVFAELARNKQTTGLGHFTVADMKRLLIVQPSSPVLVAFGEMVSLMHARIFENEQQAISLTSLRDGLLPKLMSGNIAVVGDMAA